MLPAGSRLMGKLDPQASWTIDQAILARIEYWTHLNYYAQTKDAAHKRNQPQPILPAGVDKEKGKRIGKPHNIDEMKNILSKKRR